MKDDVDERTTYLWNAVHVLERNLKVLEDQIHQTVAFREQRDVLAAKVAKALEECAAQENVPSLQRAFSTYAEATQTLSTDTRELLVVRPEQQAMVELAQIQDWAVVPMKRLLEDRDKSIKTLKKVQRDVDDMLQTNKEREKRQRLVHDQRRRVENVNALVDVHMKRFEFFRVTKLKVSSSIYYVHIPVSINAPMTTMGVESHVRVGAGPTALPLQRHRVLLQSLSNGAADRPDDRVRGLGLSLVPLPATQAIVTKKRD
ncbi:hypothetical protein H257_11347 [Aphanomyces astaci]|uniref:Uncharacterized protein n=1 Tax=Aphanomyces astaci TaxID=112090 RepID=W4G524_APHAT|nr:hypothetical protein H257_11347 [Aphanomyces astaci]ETV74033.1 hypothetical protein H257_11347 [Aphanomyces astaci]|eukprot:XP_009836548.1 hypothetical protein H257_11347 [Aphanomyces astaci]